MRMKTFGHVCLVSIAVIFCLSACSKTSQSETNSQAGSLSSSNANNLPAGAEMKVESSQTGRSSANWGADKGDAGPAPSFKRGRLLGGSDSSTTGGAAAGSAEVNGAADSSFVSQYPKWRLDKAAVIRNWANVSVVPVGIDAFLKTAWTGGNIHIRLALLGPLKNLQEFVRTQNSVKITFQDNVGNHLKEVIVPISELKEAPGSTNFGTPTYFVEGSMDCPLELYEQIYQWMFEWD